MEAAPLQIAVIKEPTAAGGLCAEVLIDIYSRFLEHLLVDFLSYRLAVSWHFPVIGAFQQRVTVPYITLSCM